MYRRILKTLGWLALAVLIVVATIVLVEIGRGYSYDFHTGRLKLNGLVIFASSPSGADIAIGDHATRHKTPYRSTLEAGEYSFTVTKAGYRSWTKRISIAGSEVSWAQYILLLPDKLTRGTWFSAKTGLSLLTTSRDHQHFAYLDSSDGTVWIFSTTAHKPTKLYTPTAPVPTQPVETVTALAFSGDASRMLVTTQSAGTSYSRLVDVTTGSISKLTEQYSFSFDDLRFNPTNASQLFWLSADGLRRIDTDSQTVSAVLVDKVAAYNFTGNGRIIYIQSGTLGQSVYSMDTAGQGKRQLIQSVVASPSYQIAFASYRSADVIAILPAQSRTITLYSQINTDTPVAKVLTKSADDMTFSPDGRFLNYRSGQHLTTYDLELGRSYNFTASKTPYQLTTWFDTYHLLVATGSAVTLEEFDGANPRDLSTQFLPGLASFTANEHEVLIAEPGTGTAVNLTAVTIKP